MELQLKNYLSCAFMKIFLRLCFLSLSLLSSGGLSADDSADRTKSIFWEIKKSPTSVPSYIYGTMHVSRKVAFKVPRQFFDAVESVDIVALESSPESWQREVDRDSLLSYLQELYTQSQNSYLLNRKDIYTRMLGIFPIYKGYIKWLISRKSSLANQLLYRSENMNQDFSEDTYLDFFIYQMGKKLRKPILSLEDVRQSTLHAYKASLYESARVLKNRNPVPRMNEVIELAYAQRDIYTLDSVYKKAFSPMYLEHLLYLRNKDMLHTFDSVAQGGQSVFMAVGAAHLPGEQGLINMLRGLGYTVRPIVDSSYFDPSLKIVQYDTLFIPSQPIQQYTIDSCILFKAPGYCSRKLDMGMVEYLCPDMPNGCYYSLNRVPLFHGLFDNENLIDRVDSLVYESTSGDITEKKRIQFRNYEAILVKSTTADAKNLQSLYLQTPYEFLIFKLIGHQKYLNDEIAQDFFESIQIKYPKGTRQIREKGLSAQFPMSPREPIYRRADMDKPSIFEVGYDAKNRIHMIVRSSMENNREFEEDDFQLRFMAKMAARELGAELSQILYPEKASNPTLEARLKKGRKQYYLQTCLRGNNYYYALIETPNRSAANDFFSHIVTDPQVPEMHSYLNDSMGYTIKTTVDPFGRSLNDLIFKSKVTQSSLANSNTKLLHSNYFVDMDLGYNVEIRIQQLHPYTYFQNVDSFWSLYEAKVLTDLQDEDPYHLEKIDSGSSRRNYIISDTGSSSRIYYATLISGDRVYEARSIGDGHSHTGKAIQEIISSFQLTQPEPSLVTLPKLEKFLEDYHSKDSLTKEIFKNNYDEFKLDSSEISALITFLDSSQTITKREEVYYFLIGLLSSYKSDLSVEFLEKLYDKNSNNFDVQFTVLRAMVQMKYPKALEVYKSKIIEEPPLSTDSYSGLGSVGPSQILRPLRDSSNNPKILFPEIMELMDYHEYNNSVVNLVSALIDEKHIDTLDYLPRKRYFRNQLWQEYRRRTATKTLLQKMDEKDESEISDDYYYPEQSYFISQNQLSNQSFYEGIQPYKFYDFSKYKKICKSFTQDDEIQKLIKEIDQNPNTDLLFYAAIERINNDSTPLSTKEKNIIRQHFKQEELSLQIAQYLLDSKYKDLLNELLPDAEAFAALILKNRLDFSPKDSLKSIRKKRIQVLGEEKDIYIYQYKKASVNEWKQAIVGLFDTDKKYIDKYSYLLDVSTTGPYSDIDVLIAKLQPQFESLDRTFIGPSDFVLERESMKEDPFYFLLLR